MSYIDPYSNPEKFGLTTVGEIDWSDGCYQFDLTVVWQRDADGQLLYAEDSGCSCPSPFESVGVNDMTAVTQEELQAHLEQRNAVNERYEGGRSAEIAELMRKVVEMRRSAS